MLAGDVVEVVRQVAATDPATCDAADLRSLASGVAPVAVLVGSVDAAVVARSAELASVGGRRSSREADVIAERAAVCAAMPEVHAALAAGELSAGHADAIARAANRLDESERVELAAQAPSLVGAGGGDVGGRVRPPRPRPRPAHLPRRRPPPPREAPLTADGASLDGPRGHVPHPDQPRPRSRRPVVSRVRRRRRRREGQARRRPHVRPAQGRRVHGDGHRDAAAPGSRRPAELLVLIDLDTLRNGLHESGICETYDGQPLPPATVRRLACEADIIPIVLDGEHRVVDVGRAKRLASADQRRALRAMHQTCAAPDCPVRFGDCDIHHLTRMEARRQRRTSRT